MYFVLLFGGGVEVAHAVEMPLRTVAVMVVKRSDIVVVSSIVVVRGTGVVSLLYLKKRRRMNM